MAKLKSNDEIRTQRAELINQFIESQKMGNDKEMLEIKTELLNSLSPYERKTFTDKNGMAHAIAHLNRTLKALELIKTEYSEMALIFGWEPGTYYTTDNDTFKVLITEYEQKVDTDALRGWMANDSNYKDKVLKVLDAKKEKITIDNLTLTDFKDFIMAIPKKDVRKVKTTVKPITKKAKA